MKNFVTIIKLNILQLSNVKKMNIENENEYENGVARQ
jgi:hypothetical protein